jgi:hypothetical protein
MKRTLMASVAAIALAAGPTIAMAQGQSGGQVPMSPGGGAGAQMQQGAPGGAAPGGSTMKKDAPGTLHESPAPGPSKGAQERGSQPNQKATQDRTVPDTKQKSTQERNTAPVEKKRSTETAPAQGGKQDKSAQTPSSGTTKQGAAKGEMKTSNVSLTTEQKTTIRNTVIKSGPKVTNFNFSISVGTVVPRTVRIAPVPVTLVSIEPTWRDHMYFIYGDEIIIVEAGTLRIVAVVAV